tara:strand:- start:344 stop:1618 length:1275 start_codon:yes stop_codon:yes gene_type:complete
MDKFIIKGPSKIKGIVSCSGSKNLALPLLAATLLFDKPVILSNVPNVRDVRTMLNLLKLLGSKIQLSKNKKIVKISKGKKSKLFAPHSLISTMRAGILVLGPLVAKYGSAVTAFPGGCILNGKSGRPIDLHLDALKQLGARLELKKGYIEAKSVGKLKGSKISFKSISVGATQQAILASVIASDTTYLYNIATEAEILELIRFLNSAGAKIKFLGKRSVMIDGVNKLNSVSFDIMGDRIEAGTFSVLACLNQGELEVKNFNPDFIKKEIEILRKIGAKIKVFKDKIFIKGPKDIKNIKKIVTQEAPGFPTDIAPFFSILLCRANGKSIIVENIFQSRTMHIFELRRLGAKIDIKGNKIIIYGNSKFLEAAELTSSDLRGSAALVLAATISKGISKIFRVYNLDRGYEKFEKKLKKIGVKVRRVK